MAVIRPAIELAATIRCTEQVTTAWRCFEVTKINITNFLSAKFILCDHKS